MRKKDRDALIWIAIIGAIATVGGAYLASPYLDTLSKEKPVIDVSLGGLGTDLPLDELPKDDNGYYLQMVTRNRGSSDGNIAVTFIGNNAKIWADKTWEYEKIVNFIIFPEPEPQPQKTTFYISPDEGASSFTIEIRAVDQPQKHQFQKINPINPIKLAYEKIGEVYKRIN